MSVLNRNALLARKFYRAKLTAQHADNMIKISFTRIRGCTIVLVRDSTISMSSRYARMRQESVSERVQVRIGPETRPSAATSLVRDHVSISDSARAALARADNSMSTDKSQALKGIPTDEASNDPKIRTIKRIIELLTGIKIETIELSEVVRSRQTQTPQSMPEPEWSIEYDREYSYHDFQYMSFEAEGWITTEDGEQIKFSLSLSMRHEESAYSATSIHIQNGRKIDPIIVNLDGEAAQLSDELFEFDLNADGKTEMIPGLRRGSGFLVLDRNGDGIVNDGTELFGPSTGNGMNELAELDSDGNRWLDERDPAWTQLYIWTGGNPGDEPLVSLAEAGIGAIYLGSVGAQFQMKNSANRPVGELARMGLYVRQNKTVGTMEQIDLIV
ncbi:MAG: hypothetical protein WBL79_11110 [Bacillota bacterium]